jgi:hypothetical protein
MQQPKFKVQCQQCRRSFVQRPNGNPWSHKCVPVRQFQVPDNFIAPQVQQARQPVQVQPAQARPVQVQQPVLNFQNFRAHFELRFQALEQREEKNIEIEDQHIEDQEVIQESIMFALAEEQEKLKRCFKEQENLDEIRGELNDGLYLELSNGLLKEVREVNKNIERYKQDLSRF